MTVTLRRVLADAWAIFTGERDLILRVAAPFVFLPAFAIQLLVPTPPDMPDQRTRETIAAWVEAVGIWGQGNAVWVLLGDAIALAGLAIVAALLVDRARPDVRGAFGLTARLYPRLALVAIITAVPTGIGLWLLVLPGLYVQARLIAALPVVIAERPVTALASIGRSVRMTRGATFALFGATTTLFLGQMLVAVPLLPIDTWLRVPTHANPVASALVGALIAGAGTVYRVAVLLVGVAAYRRLASNGI